MNRSFRKNQNISILIISIVLSYINLTYLIHLIINYPTDIKSLIFMIFINLSIIFGFFLGVGNSNKNFIANDIESPEKVSTLILFSSLIVILYSFNFIFAYYNSITEVIQYLLNPGEAYKRIKLINKYPEIFTITSTFGSTISILLTLLIGFKYFLIILTLRNWARLKLSIRIVSVLSLIIYFIYALLTGSMIAIASMMFMIFPFILINVLKNKSIKSNANKILGISGLAFIILFTISNRTSDEGDLVEGMRTLLFYISHGYIGLDYALNLPFDSTFGATTFKSINEEFVQYFSINNYFANSYLIKIEESYGWSATSVWSTIFPWIASDFSFYLVPFIFIMLSYFFGKLLLSVINSNSSFGYILLGHFFIFWFMVPANNQIFHTLENTSAFLVSVIAYRYGFVKFTK